MAGMFVPQMVAPVNTGGLADLGRSIGRYREDADIARVMKGLDPTDPNSIARTTTDLYQIPGGRDMADRLLGVWNTREQVTANRKELEAQRIRGQRAYQETLRSPAMTGAIPDDDTPGPTPPAPAGRPQAGTVTPAAQRAGSAVQPVMPTNRVWGDKEAEDAGLYEKTGTPAEPTAAATPTAPAAPVRFAGGPLQQLPPPPPRNPAATGATPVPVPPAPVPVARPAGPVPAPGPAAALPPAAAPVPATPAPGLASIPPTAPRYETLVGTPAAEIGREGPRPSDRQIEQMITELNARRSNPDLDPKYKEGVAGRIKQLEKELERRGKQDDEVYKARVKFQEGYKTKTIEHGLKRGDEIGKQLQTDYGQAAVLREQSRILDDGLRTGALSDWGKWTDRAIDFMGSMIDKLPGVDKEKEFAWVKSARDTGAAMERFHGLGAKSLHDLLGGFGGGISNVEGARLSAITAGTEKTVRGNAQLIKFTADLVEARINAGEEAQRYMRDRKSKGELIDAGDIDSIYAAHAKHAIDKMAAEHKANPLPPGPKPGEGQKAAADKTPAARGGRPPPAVGDLVGGMRFKGGDPRNRNSWEPGT